MVGRTPEYLGKKIEAKEVEDGDARPPLPAAAACWSSPRIAVVLPAARRLHRPIPARTASRRSSTPIPRRRPTTARPSAASPATRPGTTSRSASSMLIGRFLVIIPALAIAGSLVAEEDRAGLGRHLPDPWPAVRRPAGRRHPDRRRPDLLPGAGPRPDRRAPRDDRGQTFWTSGMPSCRAHCAASRASDPRPMTGRRQPMPTAFDLSSALIAAARPCRCSAGHRRPRPAAPPSRWSLL